MVQLLPPGGLTPALGQAGASGEELLPSGGFSCGLPTRALGSVSGFPDACLGLGAIPCHGMCL